jgi:cell division protein FtsI/penicillin-binding protein 2
MELYFTKGSRARTLAIIVIAVMAVFVVRLFYIQILRHNDYVAQADSEHIKQITLHAKRGAIYAMDGDKPTERPIVMNETVYTVWADPTVVDEKDKVVAALNKIAGGNVRKDFAKYLDVEKSRYQVLATKVSHTQAELLKKEKLAGIGFDAVSQRVYPEGQLASQVLGFVNNEGEGIYGFEQANDADLKGRDGLLKTVTDVRSVPLTVTDKNIRTPAVNGKNMVMTIDRNIQARTEQALAEGVEKSGADHASAIVMDPRTGKVLAMANVPTYDPSQLNQVSDVAALNNDTISRPYEAGSVVKTFTVGAGVDRGVITPESTYNNTDKIMIDDKEIGNASKGHTGTITMQTALNWSLNTGMVTIAERLGDGNYITRQARDTMYDYFYNRFRLGQRTGIELANEQRGVIVSPTEVQGNAVRYGTMSFGQGMETTMIQVASGFSALVNGGTYIAPTVIAGTMNDAGEFTEAGPREKIPGVVSAATSQTMRQMIHESHYATYNPHDGSDRYFVGGKTGTSQTLKNGKYVNDNTIATYLGFGGSSIDDPRYVIMIEISANDTSMGGGADAKPIFNAISNWLINYYSLTPKG